MCESFELLSNIGTQTDLFDLLLYLLLLLLFQWSLGGRSDLGASGCGWNQQTIASIINNGPPTVPVLFLCDDQSFWQRWEKSLSCICIVKHFSYDIVHMKCELCHKKNVVKLLKSVGKLFTFHVKSLTTDVKEFYTLKNIFLDTMKCILPVHFCKIG